MTLETPTPPVKQCSAESFGDRIVGSRYFATQLLPCHIVVIIGSTARVYLAW